MTSVLDGLVQHATVGFTDTEVLDGLVAVRFSNTTDTVATDTVTTEAVTMGVVTVQPVAQPVAPPTATAIANGVPMDLEQIRQYLQELYGIPVALREQGVTVIDCPYCGELHDHGLQTGHQVASCDVRHGVGIVLGGRYFSPKYGYRIIRYKEGDEINELCHA